MILEKMAQFYSSHKGGVIGLAIGVLIAVAILCLGLWRVLFIAVLGSVGYYLGKRTEGDKDFFRKILDKIIPPGKYR